jgi:vacuolar protein-sorting-associated protein 4
MGEMAEGYSGSDIAVVVREAIMEPLRKCQSAKQFVVNADKTMSPCEDYPNCPQCPLKLVSGIGGTVFNNATTQQQSNQCQTCGAIRISLYDIDTDKLKVPIVTHADFVKALRKAHSSVAPEELLRFVQWTEEFGQEG